MRVAENALLIRMFEYFVILRFHPKLFHSAPQRAPLLSGDMRTDESGGKKNHSLENLNLYRFVLQIDFLDATKLYLPTK